MILRRSVLLPALLAGNALFALILVGRGPTLALVVAFAPAAAIAVGALVAGDRSILAFGGLALGLSFGALNGPLVGHSLFAADLLVVLALASWAAARLLGKESRPRDRRFPVEVIVLFALLCGVAILRGHEHFGQRLFGEPLRLVLYAAVGLSLAELTPRKAHRGLVVVLYGGTGWMLLNTLYLMATGGSATGARDLSTGGSRYVALTVAMYLACALYLALLNLELAQTARARGLHLLVAGMALFQIIVSFGRTTFLALALAVPIIVLTSRRAREALLQLLPIAAPVVVLLAVLATIAWPQIPTTLVDRLNIGAVTHTPDASVTWRIRATHEIMKQFHSSPLTGVGFGKGASFTLNNSYYKISQDPHNSYVWLLAAGGVALLGSFLLLIAVFTVRALSRLRHAAGAERVIVLWSLLSLLTCLLNVAAGPLLTTPNALLVIWTLLLLPVLMAPSDGEEAPAQASDAPTRSSWSAMQVQT